MPARCSATPAAMPPKPAPTTTTRGVPAAPNSAWALGLTRRSPPRGLQVRPEPLLDRPGPTAFRCRPREQLHAVRRAGDHREVGRDASVAEPARVLDVLVAEAVGAAGDDHRRWQVRQVVGPRRS